MIYNTYKYTKNQYNIPLGISDHDEQWEKTDPG